MPGHPAFAHRTSGPRIHSVSGANAPDRTASSPDQPRRATPTPTPTESKDTPMRTHRVVSRHTRPASAVLFLGTVLAATSVPASPPDADTPTVRPDSGACARIAPRHGEGFFLAAPAHLYGDLSTFALHAGWQFPSALVRADLSVANRSTADGDSYFALPALGLFGSQELAPAVRLYEGISVGFQRGLHESFDGIAWFVDYRAGLEVLPRKNRAFFLEVGSGSAIFRKEGAFHGGTIIGGGVKFWVHP